MSQLSDMHALILKYLHDKYPEQYKDLTEQQVSLRPYHKQVWTWWEALAYYRIKGSYERLEDAQDGLRYITVIGEKNVHYELIDGKYIAYQEITKESCKAFYGDKTPGTY